MHESRIGNGMIGDGDGPPDALCEMCGAQADDCECDPDDQHNKDYLEWLEHDVGGEG